MNTSSVLFNTQNTPTQGAQESIEIVIPITDASPAPAPLQDIVDEDTPDQSLAMEDDQAFITPIESGVIFDSINADNTFLLKQKMITIESLTSQQDAENLYTTPFDDEDATILTKAQAARHTNQHVTENFVLTVEKPLDHHITKPIEEHENEVTDDQTDNGDNNDQPDETEDEESTDEETEDETDDEDTSDDETDSDEQHDDDQDDDETPDDNDDDDDTSSDPIVLPTLSLDLNIVFPDARHMISNANPIPVHIDLTLSDASYVDHIQYFLFGLPEDATLSNGHKNDEGVWVLDSDDDLNTLTLSVPNTFVGSLDLQLTAIVTLTDNQQTSAEDPLSFFMVDQVILDNNGLASTLNGGVESDYIDGQDRDDTIYGNSGFDFLWGGDGNDAIDGDNGNDELHGNNGNDNLFGGNDDDILYGDLGNDDLHGDNGNDILIGGLGADTLRGGNGADTFTWESNAEIDGQIDTIFDFSHKDGDKIDISNLFFDLQPGDDLSDFLHFAASGKKDTVIQVDLDGSGTDHAFVSIALLKNTTLSDISTDDIYIPLE